MSSFCVPSQKPVRLIGSYILHQALLTTTTLFTTILSSMAIFKPLIASLLLCLLLLNLAHAATNQAATSNGLTDISKPMDCAAACAGRCRLSKRPRLCKRACGSCCGKCQYVPPGTSGNLDACPCYANLTTHYNQRKCP